MKTRLLCNVRDAAVPMTLAACVTTRSHALEQGITAQGQPFASGGVSESEKASLLAQRERFNLWVVTAAKKTGAYLVGVQVKVTDSQQRVVFDAPLDGPWLFIELPLGRYVIEARLNGETQKHITTIHPGDHHQALFYFNVDADVLPSSSGSSQASPDDGKRQ